MRRHLANRGRILVGYARNWGKPICALIFGDTNR